jgi:hypothetical protein
VRGAESSAAPNAVRVSVMARAAVLGVMHAA